MDKQVQRVKKIRAVNVHGGPDYRLVVYQAAVLYSALRVLMKTSNCSYSRLSGKDNHAGQTWTIGRCVNTNW